VAYTTLIIFVVLFWAAAAVYPKFTARRVGATTPWSREFAGTLTIVAAWCAIGTLLNLVFPWAGTCAVVAVHIGILIATIICVARRPARRTGGGA
jgi:hypothetical protein